VVCYHVVPLEGTRCDTLQFLLIKEYDLNLLIMKEYDLAVPLEGIPWSSSRACQDACQDACQLARMGLLRSSAWVALV
jgi:hypothetical protein